MAATPPADELVKGTPEYMAPESFGAGAATETRPSTCGVSGCALYILLSGYSPYAHEDPVETMRLVVQGKFHSFEDDPRVSRRFRTRRRTSSLEKNCFETDLSKRSITTAGLRAHPWLASAVAGPRLDATGANLDKNFRRKFRSATVDAFARATDAEPGSRRPRPRRRLRREDAASADGRLVAVAAEAAEHAAREAEGWHRGCREPARDSSAERTWRRGPRRRRVAFRRERPRRRDARRRNAPTPTLVAAVERRPERTWRSWVRWWWIGVLRKCDFVCVTVCMCEFGITSFLIPKNLPPRSCRSKTTSPSRSAHVSGAKTRRRRGRTPSDRRARTSRSTSGRGGFQQCDATLARLSRGRAVRGHHRRALGTLFVTERHLGLGGVDERRQFGRARGKAGAALGFVEGVARRTRASPRGWILRGRSPRDRLRVALASRRRARRLAGNALHLLAADPRRSPALARLRRRMGANDPVSSTYRRGANGSGGSRDDDDVFSPSSSSSFDVSGSSFDSSSKP